MVLKVKVDEEACIGCGSCEHVASEYFEIKEKNDRFVAVVLEDKKQVEKVDSKLKEAIEICPVDAIKTVEKKEENKKE